MHHVAAVGQMARRWMLIRQHIQHVVLDSNPVRWKYRPCAILHLQVAAASRDV